MCLFVYGSNASIMFLTSIRLTPDGSRTAVCVRNCLTSLGVSVGSSAKASAAAPLTWAAA
jgi:hypothetical protein